MNIKTNWAISPGSLLGFIMKSKNINIDDLCQFTSIKYEDLNSFIKNEYLLSDDSLILISKYLGLKNDFLIKKNENYCIQNELLKENIKEWQKKMPQKFLKENNIDNLFNFFKVKNVYEWDLKYRFSTTMFRKSTSFNSEEYSIIAWLRLAEIKSDTIKCSKFNKELFEFKLHNDIKKLSRISRPEIFIPKLISECAEAGVRVIIQSTPENCSIYGASKLYNDNPLIVLSFRYLTDDQFWFTFYHEAGHIILHDLTMPKLEYNLNNDANNDIEIEANFFAKEMLIPYEYENELRKLKSNKKRIIKLSQELNISPGIIIGQMQHSGIIGFQYLNAYKRKYSREEIDKASRDALSKINL